MALHQYIGARYVPRFYENSDGTTEWRSGVIYEPLTIVTWNGNSYTSKKNVPAEIGNPSANPTYWVATGMFNEQLASLTGRVETLEEETSGIDEDPINALTLGIKNDGSEDISTIFNAATIEHSIYFPAGIYLVEHPLKLRNSIFGCQFDSLRPWGTIFHSAIGEPYNVNPPDFTKQSAVIEASELLNKSITVKNITIEFDDENSGYEMGVKFVNYLRGNVINIQGINIFNPHGYAGYFKGYGNNSRMVTLTQFTVWAYPAWYSTSRGFWFGENAPDCRIGNGLVAGVKVGFYLNSAYYMMSDLHIYTSTVNGNPIESSDWKNSVGISLFAPNASMCGSNIYLDGCHVGILATSGKNTAIINNLTFIVDSVATPEFSDGSVFIGSESSKLIVNGGYCIPNERIQALNDTEKCELKNFMCRFDNPETFNASTYNYRKWVSNGDSYSYMGAASQGWCKRVALGRMLFGSAVICLTTSKGATAIIACGRANSTPFFSKTLLSGTMTIYYKAISDDFYEIWADVGSGNMFTATFISVSGAEFLDFDKSRNKNNEKIAVQTANSSSDLTEIT